MKTIIIGIGLGFVLAVALRAEGPRISDKTQAAIWKTQAKINSLQGQVNAEVEKLKAAVLAANAECGAGWHMEQDAKEDLTCAANAKLKE